MKKAEKSWKTFPQRLANNDVTSAWDKHCYQHNKLDRSHMHRLITALYSLYWFLGQWGVGKTDSDWCPALWIWRESFFLNFNYLGNHLYQELVQSLLWEHGFQVDILVPHEGYEFHLVLPQNLPFSQCRVRHSGYDSMCCKQAVRGRNTPLWCEASGASVGTLVRTGSDALVLLQEVLLPTRRQAEVSATAEGHLHLVC